MNQTGQFSTEQFAYKEEQEVNRIRGAKPE